MKLLFTHPKSVEIDAWDRDKIERILYSLSLSKSPRKAEICPVNKIEEADLVIILESCLEKPQDYERLLLNEDIVRLKPSCVYTINYEDCPLGILPGIYSGLTSKNFNQDCHLSWPQVELPNDYIDYYLNNSLSTRNPNIIISNQKFLFSFRGACSDPVRRYIFSTYFNRSQVYKVVEVDKWYNHSKQEKLDYVQDILNSKFVLCPRGFGSYTHRIMETIALSRVPVIIANEWIPFSIPEQDYYIRVDESNIPNIENILNEYEPCYESMVLCVKEIYKKYFSYPEKYLVAISKIIDLHLKRKKKQLAGIF